MHQRVFYVTFTKLGLPLRSREKNLAKFSSKVAKNHIRYANKLKNFAIFVCELIELRLERGGARKGVSLIGQNKFVFGFILWCQRS